MNPVEALLSLLDPDVARDLREHFYNYPADEPVLWACAVAAGVQEEYLRLALLEGEPDV